MRFVLSRDFVACSLLRFVLLCTCVICTSSVIQYPGRPILNLHTVCVPRCYNWSYDVHFVTVSDKC